MKPRAVHPVADLFPMLAEDELRELAEDIKRRGLIQPIVLDVQGRVLDGRNRLAACELAGVEPSTVVYDGDDADGYALAVNLQRRDMTKGQKAMIVARAGCNNYSDHGVSGGYVSHARAVLEHAEDLVDAVITGKRVLDDAYRIATANKDRKKRLAALDRELAALVEADVIDLGEAERRAADGERLAKLPPDLVERVNGGMSLDEAETVVSDRERRITAWAEKIRAALDTFTRMAGNAVPADLKEHLTERELTKVSAVIGVLEPEEREADGLVG